MILTLVRSHCSPAYTQDPPIFLADADADADAGAGAASWLNSVSTDLATLLGEPASSPAEGADDGYSTTVEDEDFHAPPTQPPQWNDRFDFKLEDAPTFPGILVDKCMLAAPRQPEPLATPWGLPIELAFSLRTTSSSFDAPPPQDQDQDHVPPQDPATAALLQILTQAAL